MSILSVNRRKFYVFTDTCLCVDMKETPSQIIHFGKFGVLCLVQLKQTLYLCSKTPSNKIKEWSQSTSY